MNPDFQEGSELPRVPKPEEMGQDPKPKAGNGHHWAGVHAVHSGSPNSDPWNYTILDVHDVRIYESSRIRP